MSNHIIINTCLFPVVESLLSHKRAQWLLSVTSQNKTSPGSKRTDRSRTALFAAAPDVNVSRYKRPNHSGDHRTAQGLLLLLFYNICFCFCHRFGRFDKKAGSVHVALICAQ